MKKRTAGLTVFILFLFAVLQGRLMQLATNDEYSNAQQVQSEFYLPINNERGNIFDCNLIQLTNVAKIPFALVSPGEKNYQQMFDFVSSGAKNGFYKSSEKLKPFLIQINPYKSKNIDNIFYSTKRYMQSPIAAQLIGYINSDGEGCAGIEYAFNSLLKGSANQEILKVTTNANGEIISSIEPELLEKQNSGDGVVLCIDSRIQRICEAAALKSMDKGAIIVSEVKTGRVKASVSFPVYDPSNTSASLENENAPFINRVINQYSAGSVFKPLLAAAALETGYSKDKIYNCKGYIEVDKHIYKCAYGIGHGEVDMTKALSESCNCYFVNLGNEIGGEAIYNFANLAGFGESTVFAQNLMTAKGNLPSAKVLKNSGERANISFGQGQLMVTPAQINAFMNIFANKGVYVSPVFVEGIVNQNTKIMQQSLYLPMQRKAFSENTSEEIRSMLTQVVSDGLAKGAKPSQSTAAGKTGTAQTGRLDEKEEEYMNAWFSGFFPAENPQYTITVLLDEGHHGSDEACTIFADIANAINMLRDVDI